MTCYLFVLFIGVILYQFTIVGAEIDDDELDSLWSTDKGNVQNTYCIVPSMATNYSKKPWIYEYNLTSQDVTQFGRGAGINGDLYFFLSETRSHQADMEPIGVSNIVSDRQGPLYYTVSWAGDAIYSAKICRITHAQTSHPRQQCIVNYQLFMYINTPLILNEKYDFLVTAVSDNEIDSVPAVLNKTTLDLLWVNRHFFGAGMDGHYRYDTNMGDIFWIGGDDRLLKFNYNGQNLINNYTQSDGFGIDFVLDRQQEIIVRPWQNMTKLPWKLAVSSHDVSTRQIKLRWTWHALPLIAENDIITSPSIDEKGTVYMASMPLAFAIDSLGKTVWTSELATSSEMKTFALVSSCLTMNSKRRVLYILSGSPYSQKSTFFYFITAVNMDTGKVIKRIDLKLENDKYITVHCPVLIGDEMLYFSWLTGQYPQKVPFKVTGIEQL